MISISPGFGAFSCQLTGGCKSLGNQGVIGPILLLRRFCEFLLTIRRAKEVTVRGRAICVLRQPKSAVIEEKAIATGVIRHRDPAKASAG
jgi:hypothetical protein